MPQLFKRNITIDLLRGYFLIIIIIDHLGRFPSLYEYISGKGLLWVSAAEGFFFLSGLSLGLIRGRKDITKNFSIIVKKIYKRALLLYFLVVFLTVLYTTLGSYVNDYASIKVGYENLPFYQLIARALTFKYLYGWTDFLQYYAVFMVISPIAIYLLRKNLWYLVLIISLFVYFTFGQLHPLYTAWQTLFFIGTIVGFYFNHIEKRFDQLQLNIRKFIYIFINSVTFLTVLISVSAVHFYEYFEKTFLKDFILFIRSNENIYFNKDLLPIPRLVLFFFWFATLYYLFRKFEKQITKYFGWILLKFGENSLYTYVAHSFVIFTAEVFLKPSTEILTNFVLTTTVILLIYSAFFIKKLADIKTIKLMISGEIYKLNYALILISQRIYFEEETNEKKKFISRQK